MVGIYEIAAYAAVGTFVAELVGLAVVFWRLRQDKRKRPRK
jgi:hypothetical protein